MTEDSLLELLCETAASFYARGLAFGSTGNVSVRIGDHVWVSPTGRSLRKLVPAELACLHLDDGRALNANQASKESPFHLAAYRAAGARASALMHLHSTYTVALSCLEGDAAVMPVFTPYYQMRVLPLSVLPFLRPGSSELASAVGEAAAGHDVILLRNHGSIALGASIEEAADRIEELEETAKLWFTLQGHPIRLLTSEERADLDRVFRKPPPG
jgi:ribulose-5-phosphate 4-epimerase/fuculose-1-phosphate aldolase